MSYQSFQNNQGSSNSLQKWINLKITKEIIYNKNILDFGCNEGYFCFQLQKFKPIRITGIDKTQKTIDLAKKRNTDPKTHFMVGNIETLKTIEDNYFDTVLVLSALHYMSNPEDRDKNDIPLIYHEIYRILKPNGIFIFEGGVDKKSTDNKFIRLQRSRDVVYHPTEKKISNILTDVFSSYKYIGNSVNQKGDAIPRYVYYGYK